MQTLTAASSHLQEQLQAQASTLAELAHADHETRDALGRIEARMADQSDAHAALEGRLQAQLSDQVQTLTAASSHLQEQLQAQASTLAALARADDEIRDASGGIDARLAEQVDAHTRLEHRVQAQVLDEVQTLVLATAQLRERLAAQASTLAQSEMSGGAAQQAIGVIEARLHEAAQHQAELKAQLECGLADRADAHAQLERRLQTQLPHLAKLAGDSAENRRAVRDIERRLMAFFDHMNRRESGVSATGTGLVQESETLLDAYYVSFENTFRGTREDIKVRAEHYLESFSEAGIDKDDGLIVDLGCGRGEWLEVLTENGYACRGVDLNSVMISEVLALGLDAVESDALAYLRSLENESVLAVTSMHLVEHVPHAILIALLDEAWRVLQPGGVLILETPNPENLTVGSHWFYMDPTHRNPIPPTLLQWVVQARGFESAAIDRLTVNRGAADILPVDEAVAASEQINKIIGMLTAAPDYAIVARKPRLSAAHPQET